MMIGVVVADLGYVARHGHCQLHCHRIVLHRHGHSVTNLRFD